MHAVLCPTFLPPQKTNFYLNEEKCASRVPFLLLCLFHLYHSLMCELSLKLGSDVFPYFSGWLVIDLIAEEEQEADGRANPLNPFWAGRLQWVCFELHKGVENWLTKQRKGVGETGPAKAQFLSF